ncbi:MAG: hypothetical protein KF789_03545 [Bdellovibrionaceae bacterium]|nr:hypothetical protein [Pseudobdellovibrionaceae bacterium]
MKISISPYQLQPRSALNSKTDSKSREGVLLQLESDHGIGYADLFPWPELGDEPLSVHLESLRTSRPTALAARSLLLANRDAQARSRNARLGSKTWIKNNALVTDPLRVSDDDLRRWDIEGFSMIKVKCGADVAAEIGLIQKIASKFSFRFRLDFNSGSVDFLERFLAAFPESLDERIDYAEDPCPYQKDRWSELRKRWPLALDHELSKVNRDEELAADVLILKPARQNVEELAEWAARRGMAVTLTSSMDHPVGVAHGMAIAHELQKDSRFKILESGFLTLDCYAEESFAARFPVEGPWMAMPEGHGIGFDELFREVPWRTL